MTEALRFSFKTDAQSQAFCTRIVQAMNLLYDISIADGLALLNSAWEGHNKTEEAPFGWLIYHEFESDWARRIGNPNPYSRGVEQDRWQEREDEALRRLATLQAEGIHDWLPH